MASLLDTAKMTLSQLGYQAGLPGLGISQPIGAKSQSPVGVYAQNLYGGTPNVPIVKTPVVKTPAPTGLNTKTNTTTGGSILGQLTSQPEISPVDVLKEREMSAINDEFSQEMSRLGGLEPTTRQGYADTGALLSKHAGEQEAQIRAEQAARMGELANTETARKQEANTALAKARNLLGELNRRQQAYMSATGNFSSSVPEALSESFGKQAFASLSEIQQQRDTALRDIENKRQQVGTFYSGKLLEAKQNYENNLANLNRQLMASLDAINSAKGEAESAKRSASLDVWKQYTSNKLQIDQMTKTRQDSLVKWLATMQAQLDQAKAYQTGDVSGLNVGDVLSNLQSGLGSLGMNLGNMPSVVSKTLGRTNKDNDAATLLGLDTPYVTGTQGI
jgi:uncharacterized protein YcgL (UPF0745 family)